MTVKHNDIIPDSNRPFKDCKLNRERYADILTEIIENEKNGFVLAINNEWGTGKTTFIKMWQKSLENKQYQTLYFNAWENDFSDNAMVALISEFNELTQRDTKFEKPFKMVIEKATPIMKRIAPAFFKSLIDKYVGENFYKEILKDVIDGASDILQSEIENYSKRKKGIKEFKESLTNFIKEVTPEKSLIFFIDELDRCRPDYAVEVLEKIKHLFSVKGVVFVISIAKTQLAHAVRGVYGSENTDAEEYLKRFFDIEYSLPKPSTVEFCKYLFDYFNYDQFFFSEKRRNRTQFQSEIDSFIKSTSHLFEMAGFNLRLIERIFAHIRLSLNTFDENGNRLRADGSVIPPLKSKNNHPTVKPIALMEYLIKMITPKGGVVLDPFAGSGSTLVAAKKNGFQYIGIELTPEYIPIIEARLSAVKQELKLF